MLQAKSQCISKRTGCLLVMLMTGLSLLAVPRATASHQGRLVARLKQGIFLFARPELRDPNFLHTVILLVHYDEGGAMGLIINRPTEITLDDALPDVEEVKGQSLSLFFGGPVNRTLMLILLRSSQSPKGAVKVFDGVQFAGGKEALIEVLKDRDPNKKVRVYAGYAGWGPGQLDREVGRGDWIVSDADPEKIFSGDPSSVWPEVFKIKEEIQVRGPRSSPASVYLPSS